MSKLRVHAFSISLDGYGAGPNQDADNPLGLVFGLLIHRNFLQLSESSILQRKAFTSFLRRHAILDK
jgi:hypothetical protein